MRTSPGDCIRPGWISSGILPRGEACCLLTACVGRSLGNARASAPVARRPVPIRRLPSLELAILRGAHAFHAAEPKNPGIALARTERKGAACPADGGPAAGRREGAEYEVEKDCVLGNWTPADEVAVAAAAAAAAAECRSACACVHRGFGGFCARRGTCGGRPVRLKLSPRTSLTR